MSRQVVGAIFLRDAQHAWSLTIGVADPDGPDGNGDTYSLLGTFVPQSPPGPDGAAGHLIITGATRGYDQHRVARFVEAVITSAVGGMATEPPR